MSRGVIAEVRDLVPLRPLVYGEALQIAEAQAARFLKAAGVSGPAVAETTITDLPKFEVNRISPFPVSGATQWAHGRWHVVLNGTEPVTRQKFSLAHELKHVIDHPFIDRIYSTFPEHDRESMTERVCDYFAGCLLMPRPWVEKAWHDGNQHLGDLAEAFGVSQSAMHVRLRQIGLGEITPRCAVPGSTLSRQLYRRGSWSPKHRRPQAAALH
jgi:predicted transcriptional regulator